jgi:hypothetical protein
MHPRLPVVLLSAFALAAPGAMAYGKEKDKNKNKGKSEQRADDRRGDDDRDHRDGDRDHGDGDRDGKMTICHIPPGNRSARHTISVSESAWAAHQGHGDHRGACGNRSNPGRSFDDLDLNDDNALSFREFRGDRTVFDRLDRDDDGFLSREEYSRR